MLKFRTELEFFRVFVYNRSNYSVKCSKVVHKMLTPSLIENGFRNHNFTQYQRINSGRGSQSDGINKSIITNGDGGTINGNGTLGETVNDVVVPLNSLLKKILECRDQHISSWLIEGKVNKLCEIYGCLSDGFKHQFIEELAERDIFQNLWLFSEIGKMEKGPGYLVHLRADLINLIAKKKDKGVGNQKLHELNTALCDLLSMWFSHDHLELTRITSKSPNEILQKISKYERVHPMRSWEDLMSRMGPYRRCYVFLHCSMPKEPIIILHVALTEGISSRVTDILSSDESIELSNTKESCGDCEEPSKIRAAVFYSLSLAQKGLNGIGMSYYLIRSVGRQIQKEFPGITQFSTLSPIHTFKIWLLKQLERVKSGHNDILFPEEVEKLQGYFNHSNYLQQLNEVLSSNTWFVQGTLRELLKEPLMRLCARYLYLEKTSRGYAIDSAANLHLKNGAVIWRINWRANPHARGLNSSFGIMVNYRYYFNQMEMHGTEYQKEKKITASKQITELVKSAQKLMLNPKVKSKI